MARASQSAQRLLDFLRAIDEKRKAVLNQDTKAVQSDMPMNVLLCFLYVASHNPCRSSDIQKEFDWSAASVSRNTDWLTRQRTKNEKGLNLITKEVDPLNKRFRILKLTQEGEALANLYHSLHS